MDQIFDIFLLESVLNGLLLGGLLALLSLGLNLIFGVIDVVWICYAELIMVGMYAVYYFYTVFGWPLPLARYLCSHSVAPVSALRATTTSSSPLRYRVKSRSPSATIEE